MRWLFFFSAIVTLGLALSCFTAQEMQMGEMSAKITQTCTALAADGVVTNEREVWQRLTTGLPRVINPKWNAAMLGFLFATAMLFVAAWKWPDGIAKEDRVV